ncbi:hypothetical protein F0L68_25670 [Solihabitans fulvus]|uniref:Uncharacterized protein n=1 Tax=Solihabitans fulvus TaxID=1892852 RepID=A0A5B2WY45_9PSEU|nr:hypothetical protein [Solihabitans fulvus]KAA2256893.1 hypothetical protein F0L68_25670 [Solihabitans fulvus]
MTGLALVLVASVMVVWALLACLPWRQPRGRAWLMAAHIVASVLLAILLPTSLGRWWLWVVPLAPGALIAVVRLLLAAGDPRAVRR